MFPLSLQAKAIAGLVLVAALLGSHWYAYESGNTNGVNALLVKQQAVTIDKLGERVAANSALADRYRIEAEKETLNHEQELVNIRAAARFNAGKRVPIDPKQFCGAAGSTEAGQAGSTGSTDPGTAFLPEQFTTDLRALAEQADEVTAAYRTLRARSAACFD